VQKRLVQILFVRKLFVQTHFVRILESKFVFARKLLSECLCRNTFCQKNFLSEIYVQILSVISATFPQLFCLLLCTHKLDIYIKP
jgi:hypothetical protein